MSLLDNAFEAFTILNKATVDDGYGGVDEAWVVGATIKGAMALDSSMQAKIAEKQGVTALYTFTTRKNVNLKYHQVIKRNSDQKIFRITSDGDDKKTPKNATLNIRQVSAEEYKL